MYCSCSDHYRSLGSSGIGYSWVRCYPTSPPTHTHTLWSNRWPTLALLSRQQGYEQGNVSQEKLNMIVIWLMWREHHLSLYICKSNSGRISEFIILFSFFPVLKVEAIQVRAVSLKKERQYHQKQARLMNFLMKNSMRPPTLPCLSHQQWLMALGMAM